MNFVRGRFVDGLVEIATYRFEIPSRARGTARGRRQARSCSASDPSTSSIRGSHATTTVPAIALPVTVELTEQLGSETLLYFRADGVEAEQASEGEVELGGALVARLDPRTSAAPGERLSLGVDIERAHFFDPVTGAPRSSR